jgi:hypothetical protein
MINVLFFQDRELSVDEAVSQLNQMGITQPMLFKIHNRFWIKADKTAIQTVTNSCFDGCVELLFFSFFVFNVSYPHELKMVYGLFERLLKVKTSMPKSTILDDFLQTVGARL